jgi:hypothetical protein
MANDPKDPGVDSSFGLIQGGVDGTARLEEVPGPYGWARGRNGALVSLEVSHLEVLALPGASSPDAFLVAAGLAEALTADIEEVAVLLSVRGEAAVRRGNARAALKRLVLMERRIADLHQRIKRVVAGRE